MGLFSFLKELKQAASEGVAEAKQELAQESSAKESAKALVHAELVQKAQALSEQEIFATSLGAPYRQVFIRELESAARDERPALYLMSVDLPADELDSMRKLIERDFGVVDDTSARTTSDKTQALMYAVFQLRTDALTHEGALKLMQLIDRDEAEQWESFLNEAKAQVSASDFSRAGREHHALLVFWLSRIAYLLTTSAGLGHLSKDEALDRLQPMIFAIKPLVADWQEFADLFVQGDKLNGSNALGRKFLSSACESLLKEAHSPWVMHPWS